MTDLQGMPQPVYLALTTAATEKRRIAQLTADVPDADEAIKLAEREYAQAKAEMEQVLTAKAKEVEKARTAWAALGRDITEATENLEVGQDMIRLWCEARNRPVPEVPDLDLTMPFPVQPRPDWLHQALGHGSPPVTMPDAPELPAPALAEQTGSHPLPTDTIRQDTTTQDGGDRG
jgi:hypothetical protein